MSSDPRRELNVFILCLEVEAFPSKQQLLGPISVLYTILHTRLCVRGMGGCRDRLRERMGNEWSGGKEKEETLCTSQLAAAKRISKFFLCCRAESSKEPVAFVGRVGA